MALGMCPDCENGISTSAKSCPHCGCTETPRAEIQITCQICEGTGKLGNGRQCEKCGGKEWYMSFPYRRDRAWFR